jgi:NAD+ synthase
MARFRLTLAQLNPVVGDIDGNAAMARRAWEEGRRQGADLVAMTEMFVTGYQVQDLIMKPAFSGYAMKTIERLARDCKDGPALAIGGPYAFGDKLYNAYWVLSGGEVRTRFLKHHLPNETVFDERRIYDSGPIHGPVEIAGLRIGMPICEDAWHEDVAEAMAESGAELLLVPNGSPYYRGKFDTRLSHMVGRTVETGLPLAYLNMVGAQDDQVFDGSSFVLNPHGALAVELPPFDEAITPVDFLRDGAGWRAEEGARHVRPPDIELDYRAMVTAVHDYVRKSGFERVLLGLSGGVDSALVAAIAADALGPNNVRCVMLPSEFTSATSLEDAESVARALGCRLDEIAIDGARSEIARALAPHFGNAPPGIAEENVQSRLRGLFLMALSNRFGELLLTTGNKSEVAVGYATIYGDMAGAYNPIKDLYKTRVFTTCRWRNGNWRDWMRGPDGMAIPERVIDKPPSAELRLDQRDEDSLPPYADLDRILEQLIDREASVADVVAEGFDRETVRHVEGLILGSEYKRFQSAPGTRLTPRSFWLDRRYPIVNAWRDPG